MDLAESLIEAWEINNRINLLLLERISDEGLACTLSTRGGRDVARQFAHLHTQRLRWLEGKGYADLAAGIATFASKEQPDRQQLIDAFEASGEAMSRCLGEIIDGDRPLKRQKKGLVVSLAYFVAHESHHRGSVLLTLKQCGHPLDKKTQYAIWDWHRR